ncbi:hypothetical protein JCM1840_007617 [Sporobolomyces johnsonii]
MEHPLLRPQPLRPRPLPLKRHPTSPISRPGLASFTLTPVPPLVRAVTANPVEPDKRVKAAEEQGTSELEVFATSSGVQEDASASGSARSQSPLIDAHPNPLDSTLGPTPTDLAPNSSSSSSSSSSERSPSTAFPTRPSQLRSPPSPSPSPSHCHSSLLLFGPPNDRADDTDLPSSPYWSPEFLSLHQTGGGGSTRPLAATTQRIKISYDVPEENEAWSALRVAASGGTTTRRASTLTGTRSDEGERPARGIAAAGGWDFERIFGRRRWGEEGEVMVMARGEEGGRRPGEEVRGRKVAALKRLQAVGAQLSWGS